MEDSRTSTSTKGLSRISDPLLESPEAELTEIPVVRCEQISQRSSRDIPVSVQVTVYGSKETRVGPSSQIVDRDNELAPSSEEALGTRKDRRPSVMLESNVCLRETPTDKSLVEKPQHYIRE
ncbi:hypothetical protein O181_112629 [Austropuccinia psidii MF-1]|uniref:Uncharacterized protein n=1 Tax=Austropuccinia psidii MF-1 TaxID=1389203 RepID=A0A9Q3PSX4_9BASI|nr:hypothetical protein [Austropuccinia psidii MF-1]